MVPSLAADHGVVAQCLERIGMTQDLYREATLLPYVTTGMTVYDVFNEPLGTVERIDFDDAIIEVGTERWRERSYRVRADQVMSVGFARVRLRTTGAELEKS